MQHIRICTTIGIENFKIAKLKGWRMSDLLDIGINAKLNFPSLQAKNDELTAKLMKQERAINFLQQRMQEMTVDLIDVKMGDKK
jgi:hypothetical protein